MSNFQPQLEFARQLAHQAGDIMLKHFQIGIDRQTKADDSPVTIADLEINQLVLDAVQATYPHASILAEEGSKPQPGAADTWVCDPIDGTIPYTLGMPTSMFSLALVQDGQPVLGVLYDPYTKRLYEAVKGQGAHLNGRPIHVSSDTALRGQRLAMPAFHLSNFVTAGLLTDAIDHYCKILALSCATYESALVATGQIGGAVYPWSSPWDIAAIKVILEEAGGRVTSLSGTEQRYDQDIKGAILSNGHLHDQLLQLVRPHLKSS